MALLRPGCEPLGHAVLVDPSPHAIDPAPAQGFVHSVGPCQDRATGMFLVVADEELSAGVMIR